MIGPICLIAVGAFGALYFTHKTFRDRVNDLCGHVKSLFVKDEPPAPVETGGPATTVTITPAPAAPQTVTK